VRIYETHGKHASGKLNARGSISECDMMEWKKISNNSNGKSQINVKLTPFEIKTYRIKLN
jgi:alpha-mannosidase